MIGRKFIKGKTYYTSDVEGWVVFRPSSTQIETDRKTIIKGHMISNLNAHWSEDKFIRKDGICTHPWGTGRGVSVHSRDVRLATPYETRILDRVIETGEALTEEEMRAIQREMKIEELGI